MTRISGLLLLLGFCSAPVLAQNTTDPMEACSRLSDGNARLACFDREIQRRHAAAADTHGAAAAVPAAAAAPVPVPVPSLAPAAREAPPAAAHVATDDTIGLDGKQLSLKRREEGIAPPAATRIVAGLSQLRPRPGHQYYFELDNGQVWESVENEGQLFVAAHETVSIRSGMLGSFFLKTQEGDSIRVHRLK